MATQAELKARLSLDSALFERGIALAHSATGKLGTTFTTVGGMGVAAWAKIGAAVAALGGAAGFVRGVHNALELGSSLKEMSDRTGIAVDKLVVLQEAFRQAGLDASDVGTAINKMQRYIEQAGPEKLGDAFYRLQQLRPEEQFGELARVISSMPTASQRAAASIEAFGKAGGRLLQVFASAGGMADIQRAIGQQADLLGKNADKFDDVADKLRQIGTQLRGFFVGVAAGVVNFIQPIVNQLANVDFTAVGKKFGEALVSGAKAIVGFFQQPELFFTALKSGLAAAVLSAGNVLIAVFKSALVFFQEGFASMFVGLGSVITATLIDAFQKPIAWFQAQIIGGVSSMQKVMEALKPSPMMPWTRAKMLFEASHGGAEEAAKAYQEILKQPGGPRVGLGEGLTAEEYRTQARDQLKQTFDAAGAAMKEFKFEDIMNAGPEFAKAMEAAGTAVKVGSDWVEKNFKESGQKVAQAFTDAFAPAAPRQWIQRGGPRTPFIPGVIMESAGIFGGHLGGPQAVVSERHMRRERWLAEREAKSKKDSLATTNELLEGIKTYTGQTAQTWK